MHLPPITATSVFYKLLDELQTECEDLEDRGISGSGTGFDGPSAGRLGAHSAFVPTHNPKGNHPGAVRSVLLQVCTDGNKTGFGWFSVGRLDAHRAFVFTRF